MSIPVAGGHPQRNRALGCSRERAAAIARDVKGECDNQPPDGVMECGWWRATMAT